MSDLRLSRRMLVLLPCSGAKAKGSAPSQGRSILDHLEPSLGRRLGEAREVVRERALVDSTAMAACKRYTGELYVRAAGPVLRATEAGQPILIVSGGYGLVEPTEPIGHYDKALDLGDWPAGLLEDCIADYARCKGATSILAVMARTSTYAKLVRKLKNQHAGLVVILVSPVSGPNAGAQGKVPRAQGQVLAQLLSTGSLSQGWNSDEGLPLDIRQL
jgi:hypothetical protein